MSRTTCSALLAILLLTLAAGRGLAAPQPVPQRPVDALVERLKAGQLLGDSIEAEMRALTSRGVDPREAIPALKPLLVDGNIMRRMLAGQMLWAIGPAGIDAVFAAYDDSNPKHRRFIIEVLGNQQYSRAAESSQVSGRLLQIFRRGLKDQDGEVRWAAVSFVRMSSLPSEDWAGDLAQRLTDADPLEATEIERGLSSALDEDAAGKPGKQLSPALRQRVLEAMLGRFKADLASGQNARVWQVLNNLGTFGSKARSLAPELVRIWSATGDQSLKGSIEGTLRQVAPGEQLLPAPTPSTSAAPTTPTLAELTARLGGSDPTASKEAAEMLGKMGGRAASAVPALAAMVREGRKRYHTQGSGEDGYQWHWVAIEAMQALGAISAPAAEPAVPELLDTLYDQNSEFRYWAVKALGQIGQPTVTVLPALVRMLSDNDEETCHVAAEAFSRLGSAATPVLPQLLKIYKADEHGIRKELIWSLVQIDRQAALPLLIEGLTEISTHGYSRQRYAVLLGELGPAGAAAIPALVDAIADPENAWFSKVGEKALLQIAGRESLRQYLKEPDSKRRTVAMMTLRDYGTAEDLPVIESLKQSADRAVAAAARETELVMRRSLFGESREKTLAELLADFRVDDVPGNAEEAWRQVRDDRYPDKLDQFQHTLATTTDTQQRKTVAMLLADNPMTTPTRALLGLVVDNLRTGSLAEATHDAVEWLIMTPLPEELTKARLATLQADEKSTDSQLARLAALALQYDARYQPTPAELALMAENLEDDGIAGNAELALEILARRDAPGKRQRLVKLLGSSDSQAAGRAAVALLDGPDGAKMTPRLLQILVENLKLENDIAGEVVDRSLDLLGKARLPEKREILEAALRSPVDNKIFHRRVARLLLAMPGYRPSPAMIDHLIRQLRQDEVTNNAGEAVQALIKLRSPLVIKKLERALDSDDRQQRLWATDALPAPHEYPGGAPRRLLAVLLENLDDEYQQVSGAWCDDYRTFSNAKDTVKYLIAHPTLATRELEASLDAPDPQRRWLAAIILGSTGRGRRIERITQILIPQMRVGGADWMAGHALEGLGQAVRPYLGRYRNDPDPELRAGVALILADLKRPPKTEHDLYMREDKYGLRDTRYLIDLPEYWRYQDRP